MTEAVEQRSPRRDIQFSLLTALVVGVTLNALLALYYMWHALQASRYAPTPTVILIAVTVCIPYYWVKVLRERTEFMQTGNSAGLRALYKGLFMTCMVSLLLLIALHQITAQ